MDVTDAELAACGRALLRLVETPGPLDTPCWLWPGSRTARGDGKIRAGGNPVLIHRLVYRILVGSIAAGLELDHLCRRPSCANPAHLEPVTHAENVRRAAALVVVCVHGHEYTSENTGISNGRRRCLTCHRDREANRRLRAA